MRGKRCACCLDGFGSGVAWLRSVAVCFTVFCVSSPNEREATVGFGSSKRVIMSVIY